MNSVFFFSSRRRHTRSKRDWSSDVCSSDLWRSEAPTGALLAARQSELRFATLPTGDPRVMVFAAPKDAIEGAVSDGLRSEERRVGKECRSRWSRDQSKKKNEIEREFMIDHI